MRVFPVLLSILVGGLLYLWIMEREWLYARIGIDTAPAEDAAQTSAVDTAPDDAELIKVIAVHSTAQVIDTAVVLRGETEALRQVDVRSETSATVVSTPLRKGAFVEEGQILCELDPGTRPAIVAEARARLSEAKSRVTEAEARGPEAQARLAEAEARLEEALTNDNVAVQLSSGGYASDTRVKNTRAALAAARAGVEAARSGLKTAQAGVDSARAGVESAQASVAAAEKEIERLTLVAPFAGLLESDGAELGTLLQTGGLCATVIQLDPIKLVAFVPETDVSRIKLGAQASARLTDGQQVSGVVTFLSRSADETTRTFRVEIEADNAELDIRDGQTAEILISTAGQEAHLLPASALTLNDEGTLGLRVLSAGNIVAFAPVTILRDTTQGVWLTGLPPQADVIIVGQEYVTEGVRVAPSYEKAKT
ncbi:efflux RND transporter periplasmic adaptor subunit [Aliishimia ponticola]|uniref:Efflux RND transporter periplasmic adaptor subunit n=1 Tax=Aliishimia ponticola TaxID=2499833 RepID=A0A4S4NJT7_9RHOB|nr:efflux RND transporter periplasmic adaptor subunit [Aliishimia ponticola]THH39175.1 efflux RND transporter periplasmic adaptor subunit [Aliishimia ponticola]